MEHEKMETIQKPGETLASCLLQMMENGMQTDMTVAAIDGSIDCHKLVLMRSPTLRQKLEERPDTVQITIQTLKIGIVTDMIRFLYTEKIKVTDNNVIDLLYLSKYLKLPMLEQHCTRYLSHLLNAKTLCVFMQISVDFAAENLRDICVGFTCCSVDLVDLVHDNMLALSQEALYLYILMFNKQAHCRLERGWVIKVFNACVNWCKAQCAAKGMQFCSATARDVIGRHVLRQVPLASLSWQDIMNLLSSGFYDDVDKRMAYSLVCGVSKPVRREFGMMPYLVKSAVGSLDVCAVLEDAINLDVPALVKMCLRAFSHDTETVLTSPAYPKLTRNALCQLLSVGRISCKETVLYDYVYSYAYQKCKCQNINPIDGSAIRRQLGSCLYKIRFSTMPLKYFNKNVVPEGLLSSQELVEIYQFLTSSSKEHPHPVYFLHTKRYVRTWFCGWEQLTI